MGKKKGGKKPASSEGPKPPETQAGPSRPQSEPSRPQSEPEMAHFPALGEEGGRRGGRMRGRGRGTSAVEPPPPEPSRGPPPGLSGVQATSPSSEQAQSRESGSGSRGIGRGGRGGRGGPGESGEGTSSAAGHVGAGGEQGDQGAGAARDWRGGGRGGGGNGGAGGGGRGERGRGRGSGSQGPWGTTQPPPPQQQPVFQPPPGLSRTPSVASVGAGDTPQQQRPQQISSPTSSAGRGQPVQTVQGKPASVSQQPRQSQPQQQQISNNSELTKKMQKLTIPQHLIPLRKARGESVGTRGRKIMLEVNHLALALKNVNMVAIHYDVAFKPDSPKRLFRLVMQEFQKLHYPKNYPAFDGRKNLFSCGYLPGGSVISGSVKVYSEEDGKEKEFEVTVKFAAKVDMSPLIKYMNQGSSTSPPQEALQAIDIVLRNPAALRFVAVGRSFFTAPRDGKTTIDLGDGLELWYGFYQSAILGWKPYLNVDVAHKGFPKPDNLIKVILDQTQLSNRDLCRELDVRQKEALSRFIVGLKIEYELPGLPITKRTYKVNRVLQCSVKERFMFEKDGQKAQISVGEYYEKHKNFRLAFPYMPCLHVGPNQKNIYVPVELCRIAKGQALMKKLNEKQTAAMVRNAAQPADVRKKRILDAIRMANFNSDPCVREFGITVNDQFTPVTGRILEAPLLRYEKQEVKPIKGVWRSSTFLTGQSLGNWCILNLENRTRDDSLLKFAKDMAKIGRDLGVNINPNPRMAAIRKRPFDIKKDDISRELTYCKNDKVELVVVVIPDAGDTYGKVKQAAELEVGILTQCVKSKTIFRLSPATVSNILLKVNSKLNGVNHTIGGNKPMVLRRPIMIVGADVTHPSPDQTQIPSVAAVAASHDPKAFQYNMLWRLQPPRVEIIEDLENVMKEQLLFFYKKTNLKPERIFFYRDGVSEGQFSQVLDQELQAIRRACSAIQADYKPNITFLVVQKRHHTRFFPTRTEDEDGKNKNVPAGTIVDTTITHPTEFDFYLVSHASIQGTSRPTKYHLLWDDNDMAEDDLEELTYYLCHLFSRCTRSVSYPAPTYYAHLAAFRARVYLEGQRINLNKLSFEEKQREIKTSISKDSPMFFV